MTLGEHKELLLLDDDWLTFGVVEQPSRSGDRDLTKLCAMWPWLVFVESEFGEDEADDDPIDDGGVEVVDRLENNELFVIEDVLISR